MEPLLYRDLVGWYHLLDPVSDHADEAALFESAFECAVDTPRTLLELGAGAGNNASFLKRRFACTLTDLSEDMLALSRARNPSCDHLVGDMRTLRLGRTFDCVLVHDAISYMTTSEDLSAALKTAFVHTRPGGAALFVPDCVREDFREHHGVITGDDGERSLRCLEWHHDPDPSDDAYVVDFAFLLRENGSVRATHDRHVQGLFARDRWLELLAEAGFATETRDAFFLGRRPAQGLPA